MTPAWEGLKDPESKIYKVITSSVFSRGTMGGDIDVCNLIMFGFLHCAGKKAEKNEILYTILQDGGPARHPFIGHSDKDYEIYLGKLMKLCTFELA